MSCREEIDTIGSPPTMWHHWYGVEHVNSRHFQGFVIKWIHNPARKPVSGYKIKWESTKYRSKMAVGTYELSIENWTYGSDETYPKQVLQDFKKVPFFLKIAYFAPLNALRAHTAWSKKTTLLQRFLGPRLLTTLHLSGPPGPTTLFWPLLSYPLE